VDQEVHVTAGREAGATGSRSTGTVEAIGNQLDTNWQTALVLVVVLVRCSISCAETVITRPSMLHALEADQRVGKWVTLGHLP